MESVLGSFYEGFVGLDLFIDGKPQEGDNDTEQHKSADKEAGGADGFCRKAAEINHDGDHNGNATAKPGYGDGVLEFHLLEKAQGDNACDGAEEGRKQKGQEYVARVRGTQLGTVGHDAHGNERKPAGVQHQEHDLGIAGDGLVFVGVDFLQLLHGLEAHGSGGVIETQHVRADVHEHGAHYGVAFGDFGEQAAE